MTHHRRLFTLLIVALLAMMMILLSPAAVRAQGEGPLPEGTPGGVTRPPRSGDSPIILSAAPTISVWYGDEQSFGQRGIPQRWINILGNVSDVEAIDELSYKLNTDPSMPLSIGPNTNRLLEEGDFNIEIDYRDLQEGENTVVIRASYNGGSASTTKTVTVNWTGGQVWPNPYYIDWSTVSSPAEIQDVAQIVDGQWDVTNDGLLYPVVPGYDRIVAIGQTTWQDYDVVVPITIDKWYGGSPGVGILVRWDSHREDSQQPHYAPLFGGLGWYRYYNGEEEPWLTILGMDNEDLAVDKNSSPTLGQPYIYKIRAETVGDNTRYRLKVWEAGDPEPSSWDLEGMGNDPDRDRGSVLLVAHRADTTFGNVTITPIMDGYPLVVNTGGGTVTRAPDKAAYGYAEEVILEPVNETYRQFEDWGGPDVDFLQDNGDGTWSIKMVKPMELTANFTQLQYQLSLTIEGQGTVLNTPGNPYDPEAIATLRPVPETGWHFARWNGPDAASLSDNFDGSWSVRMDSDKEVTAIFMPSIYLPLIGRGF
jgi:hypothetical protein